MVYAEAARRTPFAAGPRASASTRWSSPSILGLAGIAWAVNDAIEHYHDRIALKGLDGKPSPIALTVGGEPLVIPANMIRFPTERRGGAGRPRSTSLLHWPSLDGFSEERAKEFRDGSPQAPLLYVTITAPRRRSIRPRASPTSTAASSPVRRSPVPAGLVGRTMDPDISLSRRDRLFRAAAPRSPSSPAASPRKPPEMPATCIRDVNIGHGLTMLYRFNRAWLGDWQDDGRPRCRRLVDQFFRRA